MRARFGFLPRRPNTLGRFGTHINPVPAYPIPPACKYVQMSTPDSLPEGVTIRARFKPLSDVTSKCGYICVSRKGSAAERTVTAVAC